MAADLTGCSIWSFRLGETRDVCFGTWEPENEFQRKAREQAEFEELNKNRIARDMKWMDSRMEDARMAQCLATIQSQAETAAGRPDKSQIVNERAHKEVLMSKEIKTIEDEKACALLRRHHLRQMEPSLRELMSKIQAGYVSRDVKQQIVDNQYRRARDRLEELKKDQFLNNLVYNEIEQAAREEKQEFDRMMSYKKEITKQKLEVMERQQKEQEEERLKSKKMLEDIKRKVAEDEFRELQQKNEKKEKLRQEMLDFQEKRRIWKEQELARAKAEEQRLMQQALNASEKETIVAKREEKFRKTEKINEKIMNKVRENEAETRKRADLTKLLQEQEYLEKNVQDEIAEKKKEHSIKRETKDVLMWQMQSRIDAVAQERAREVEFMKNAEKRAYEELQKERKKELQVKERRRRYAEELKQQMLDNEVRRKIAREEDEQRVRNVFDHGKAWLAEVKEERKRIVEEHVPHVLGYLQKGVIEPDDLSAVKEGALKKHEQLTSLDIDSMRNGRRQKYPKCNDQCSKIKKY